MASTGLNKWIVSGHLAADVEVKTIELKDGRTTQVANPTLYVQKPRNREDSFTVRLNIWDNSVAWRKLQFLKKGALIICTGSIDTNPYISNVNNLPKAGIEMTVLDIDLDIIPKDETNSAMDDEKVAALV
jgi:single-strand DNA-binding protein